jgi:hypothetical protein
MRREQNFHGGKLKGEAKGVKKFQERAGLKWWAQKYVDNGAYCLRHGIGAAAVPFYRCRFSKSVPALLTPGLRSLGP